MTFTTRDATVSDAGAIHSLFRSSFTDTFGHLYSPANLTAFLERFSLGQWAKELTDPAFAFRIAEMEGRPVGFAKVGPNDLPVDQSGEARELYNLYLLEEAKGSGAAKSLMDWAVEEARRLGGDKLYLSVFVDNHRARRFYQRFGFTEVGPYIFMVGDHEDDDVIMELPL